MIKLLKQSDYKKSLWKNGLGSTEEIFIYPESAQFPRDPFWFRLSSALIQAENEFSNFAGYQRLLTVIEGPGLELNGTVLKLDQIFQFSGDEKINCKPLTSAVTDLGLIFNNQLADAEMQLLQFGDLHMELDPKRFYFIICTEGVLTAPVRVRRFETLVLHNETSVQLKSPDAIAFLVTVTLIESQ